MTSAEPAPDAADSAASRSLDRSLLGGLAWTTAVRWSAQLLSWSSTIVIAHRLTRGDYGIVGAAMVYLGVIQPINEFGVGVAIMRDRELDDESCASLGGLSVAIGFLFFALSVAAAQPIARFFREDAVAPVIVVLATTFIISGFRVLPNALLSRDREFKRLARIDGWESVCQTATTLSLALAGYGYWSIVVGAVTGTLISAVLTIAARPHRLSWPRALTPIIRPLTTGWQVTMTRVAWYAYSNADFAIVGRVLGKIANGTYAMAWQIASIPVDKTSGILSRVTLPVFSEVQNNPAALSRYVRGLSEGLSLLTFPLTIGLALVADDFVPIVLGREWVTSTTPLRVLLLYAGFRSLMTLFPNVLIAIGQSRRTMWVSLVSLAIMPPAFYVGTRWGPGGVAMAWLIAYPLIAIPMLMLPSLKAVGIRFTEYAGALWPAVCSSLVMTAAIAATSLLVPQPASQALWLAIQVLAGAAGYLGTVFLLFGDRAKAFMSQVRPPT